MKKSSFCALELARFEDRCRCMQSGPTPRVRPSTIDSLTAKTLALRDIEGACVEPASDCTRVTLDTHFQYMYLQTYFSPKADLITSDTLKRVCSFVLHTRSKFFSCFDCQLHIAPDLGKEKKLCSLGMIGYIWV